MSLDARVVRRVGALDIDVGLRVADAEVVAVLGPNGAGKTTLLRCLAGLDRLGRGHVRLGGRTLEDVERGVREPAGRRDVGVVFQDLVLFPHLSAIDNIAFGARSHGASRSRARALASDWLERVGLADRGDARPRELSGGEAQRVALARALALEPSLLLLDEPLSALDVGARKTTRRVLRDRLADFPGPTVLVTHEPLEAIALADRLVIVEHGRVTQEGPPAEVARRPRSEWVASLVGLNLYRGRADGHTVALASGERLVSDTAADGDVYAVVHPRAVALHPRPPEGSPRNSWRGTVDGIDLESEHVRVHVAGQTPIVAQITPGALADLRLVEGRQVWVAVKATEIDLYPR